LITIVKKPNEVTGRITVIRRSEDSQYSTHGFFDVCTPYIQELTPDPYGAFVF